MDDIAREAGDIGFLIVKNTILLDLITLVPRNKLEQYQSCLLEEVPDVESSVFGQWVKKMRAESKLTQDKFVEKLKSYSPKLKLHPSDIGNLETGKRLKNYRRERREIIKSSILKVKWKLI